MAPKIAAGVMVTAGNMKPVTPESTVVTRNSAVHPGILCAPSMPYKHDEARHDADQADGNMQLGEGGNR